jgi:4-azaleucine resistance transporter AzlC
MRSIWRTLDRDLMRDVALVGGAAALVGLSFGALTVSDGLPIWLPTLLSVVVFAGGAQFMFVGIIASGGNPVAALLAGLLVNARHLPFGFAIGDAIGTGRFQRAVGSFLMIDESVAFALAQDDEERRRTAYWMCGIGLFVFWNVGVVIGALGATVVTDTDALGLDAAFPAVLLALILPMLKDRVTRTATLIGVLLAVVATPFVPAGVPVLIALVGVAAALGNREQAEMAAS